MEPMARRDGILALDMDDELVVYDERSHQAHSLNRTAATVWRACDGQADVPELARRVQALAGSAPLGAPEAEHLVKLALDDLRRANLLAEPIGAVVTPHGASRRTVLRQLGVAAGLGLLLPVVTSIVAPTPAMAQSGAGGYPCPDGRYTLYCGNLPPCPSDWQYRSCRFFDPCAYNSSSDDGYVTLMCCHPPATCATGVRG